MGFNHLKHAIDQLTHDKDEKIATLAEAIQQLNGGRVMCLPWNHKWETTDTQKYDVYSYYNQGRGLPLYVITAITQRCTHCGKEIVRKYRV